MGEYSLTEVLGFGGIVRLECVKVTHIVQLDAAFVLREPAAELLEGSGGLRGVLQFVLVDEDHLEERIGDG